MYNNLWQIPGERHTNFPLYKQDSGENRIPGNTLVKDMVTIQNQGQEGRVGEGEGNTPGERFETLTLNGPIFFFQTGASNPSGETKKGETKSTFQQPNYYISQMNRS